MQMSISHKCGFHFCQVHLQAAVGRTKSWHDCVYCTCYFLLLAKPFRMCIFSNYQHHKAIPFPPPSITVRCFSSFTVNTPCTLSKVSPLKKQQQHQPQRSHTRRQLRISCAHVVRRGPTSERTTRSTRRRLVRHIPSSSSSSSPGRTCTCTRNRGGSGRAVRNRIRRAGEICEGCVSATGWRG